ncbi:glycoside hydrolase family 108 protein [Chelatococcus sp. GCM10030263]|uniref:glycoside hydrolase family 108 protein n=1 Tax=Chelatococcus sp. GCM10030263 TaxID=3273387 RepID=UPI00360B8F8D
MAAANFDLIIGWLFKHEGGLSMDRKDPGNWTGGKVRKGQLKGTKYGISAAAFPKEDIAGLTKDKAIAIYKRAYWDVLHCDLLPAGADYVAFDGGVNSGTAQSAKWLQRAVGVTADGIIGAQTLAAVEAAARRDEEALINSQCDQRLAFMKGLSTWKRFGGGWETRVGEVRTNAIKLARADQQFGAVTFVAGMEKKARPTDTRITASTEGKIKVGTAAAAVAGAAASVTQQLSPFADIATIRNLLVGLALVGAVAGLIVTFTRHSHGEVKT